MSAGSEQLGGGKSEQLGEGKSEQLEVSSWEE